MLEEDRRQRYAEALRAMCKLRGIPATGYALARVLQAAGRPVHANTLDKLLRAERSARGATTQKILSGLSASNAERAMLLAPERTSNRRLAVSWRDALVRDVDKGRDQEEVRYWYRIGTEDDGDSCVEQRRTVVGPDGLRAVSFGPGQRGALTFDLLDTTRLGLAVRAERLEDGELVPVPAAAHVVEVEPGANKYAIIVRFGELIPAGTTVVWTVRYRWPGMWRSLRLKGVSSSTVNFLAPPTMTKASIECEAPAHEFADLQLVRLQPDSGVVEYRRGGEDVRLRWVMLTPPSSVHYQLLSARHA